MAQRYMAQFMGNDGGEFLGADLALFIFVVKAAGDEDAPIGCGQAVDLLCTLMRGTSKALAISAFICASVGSASGVDFSFSIRLVLQAEKRKVR